MQLLGQRPIAMVVGLYFLTFLSMTNLSVALALLVEARFGWTGVEVGRLFGIFGVLALVIQGLLIVRLSRIFGPLTLLLVGTVVLAAGMGMVGAAHHPWLMVTGIVLIGGGLGVANPLLAVLATQLAGAESRGAVLGVAQSSGSLARAVGPLLAGFLFRYVAPGAPFFGGAVSAALAAGVVVAVRRVPAAASSPPSPEIAAP
jgi:MFS family permease